MADEQHPEDRGPVNEGNGGPVTPGAGPPQGGAHGTGRNGVGGPAAHPRGSEGAGLLTPEPAPPAPIERTRVRGLWVGAMLSVVVLLLLLMFVLQNIEPTRIRFLGTESTLPIGVALLFAAALGVLLVAIPGYLRIVQLRRQARKRDSR